MITSSNMDDSISETETAPEAPPPPVFDATPWPVAQRPAARPPSPVRIPRDLGPRMWTAALAAALLFTAGGLALLYLDDTNSQNAANRLNAQNQALNSQNKQLQAQLLTTQTNLTATQGELATVRTELEHPTLTIWNVPQQIQGPDWYLAGGAPDTFTYHLRATSTGPMSISILTLKDFAEALNCVTNGRGVTNYCMHHTGSPVISWLGVTTVNYDFHGAEGCADYVVAFTSSTNITVTPNVGVTYNPSRVSTGSCA
jgi:hypothetical protein